MTNTRMPKVFRSLRGAIGGEESDEAVYFDHSATLRIYGDGVPFEEISTRLGVQPTTVHRKSERRGPNSPPYEEDAWLFQPAVPKAAPIEEHIDALWQVAKPHVQYLRSLKNRYNLDVFCGYRSNCDHAGIQVPHTSLELFTALEVPFGVSIIIA